jgi:catechol 2,3-dioxygenase-like lactoylglutathione lyase family enzyme
VPETQLQAIHIDHINQLIGDYDAAIEHYGKVFGAELEYDGREAWGGYNNCVLLLGTARLEIFSPVDPEDGFARQHRRYGNAWQALLWTVPNLEEALDILRSRNVRLVNVELQEDRRWAFTDPRDTFGMVMQIEDRPWPAVEAKSPFGLGDLTGLTVAVTDADAAATFFHDLFKDSEIVYREDRPKLAATAVGLQIAHYTVEFLSPTGPGEIQDSLDKYRPRIRTATWRVASLDAARAHFAGHGITLIDGDRGGTLTVPAADNLDVLLQFTE